jgi:hypothetical protein
MDKRAWRAVRARNARGAGGTPDCRTQPGVLRAGGSRDGTAGGGAERDGQRALRLLPRNRCAYVAAARCHVPASLDVLRLAARARAVRTRFARPGSPAAPGGGWACPAPARPESLAVRRLVPVVPEAGWFAACGRPHVAHAAARGPAPRLVRPLRLAQGDRRVCFARPERRRDETHLRAQAAARRDIAPAAGRVESLPSPQQPGEDHRPTSPRFGGRESR